MFSDKMAIGNNPILEGAIDPTGEIFFFACIAVTVMGLLVGFLEVVFINRLFTQQVLWIKIGYKFLLYTLLFSIVISIVYPMAAAIEMDLPLWKAEVWKRYAVFWGSLAFWSTCLQLFFSLMLSLFYGAISENLGHSVLINFITGKYNSLKQEERFFMFVDMTASTAIAEKLGHKRYFQLIQRYYEDLSNAIIKHKGEVYQYVGDEIVITWPLETGVEGANCIRCFYAMQEDLGKKTPAYEERFGLAPRFKAGLHAGTVSIGEIGALKKEIVFTGDPLNVTARIQGLCKELQENFIISAAVIAQLPGYSNAFQSLGTFPIKGRQAPMEVFHANKEAFFP